MSDLTPSEERHIVFWACDYDVPAGRVRVVIWWAWRRLHDLLMRGGYRLVE